MAKKVAEPVAPAPVPERKLEITLLPSPEAAEGIALRATTMLDVVDKESHELALNDLRRAKQIKRRIEEHWSRIKRNVDDLKRNLLDLERKDLEPVVAFIAARERQALDYQNGEARRVREEEDRRRRIAEEQARNDREALLRKMEAEALKAEASSPNLSPREQVFVDVVSSGTNWDLAAKQVGYKDPSAGDRLMHTPKIIAAIESQRKARQIREQQQAERDRPLDVVTKEVVRQTAKVIGTRNTVTYSARVDDIGKVWAAVTDGKISREVFLCNEVWLNQQARQLKEAFEQVFPGCTLIKKEGIAG